jgi:hypothetical protein
MSIEAMKLALEALKSCSATPHWTALQPTIKSLEEALAKQEQGEPLFWYKPLSNGMYYGPIHNAQIGDILRGIEEWIPLYTTPPKRKPLTNEECDDLWDVQLIHITDKVSARQFIRDIEAAHGIKE